MAGVAISVPTIASNGERLRQAKKIQQPVRVWNKQTNENELGPSLGERRAGAGDWVV